MSSQLAVVCSVLLTACVDSGSTATDDHRLDDVDVVGAEGMMDTRSEFRRWLDCMQYEDFVASNLGNVWATENAPCASCHRGEFGSDPQMFFDYMKSRTYTSLVFFSFNGEVVVNERTIPAAARADDPLRTHPKFNASLGMTALHDFYDRTNARFLAGSCP